MRTLDLAKTHAETHQFWAFYRMHSLTPISTLQKEVPFHILYHLHQLMPFQDHQPPFNSFQDHLAHHCKNVLNDLPQFKLPLKPEHKQNK